MARILLLLGFIALPAVAYGQQQGSPAGTLTGRIVSRETQRGLEAARVEVLGTPAAASTGANGGFTLRDLAPGVYSVRFSAIGYQPFTQSNVVIGSGRPATVLIELDRQPLQLESIAVTAAPYFQPALQAPSVAQSLNAEDIRRAPGVQEDVIRAVALLPGVGVTTGGRNDLIVRGGAPFENLFLVDGIEVPNLNHFGSQGSTGGPLSLINIDFVQSAEFSTGGFGVRYGDRSASVTSVNLREGNPGNVAGMVNLSATGLGAIVEGPLGTGGSFLGGLRRSYLDLVFRLAGFSFRPTYYDGTIKIVQPIGKSDRVSFLAIGALDDVAFDNSTPDNRYDNSRILGTSQDQYFAGLTWQRSLASGLLEVSLGRTFSRFESTQTDSLQRTIFANRSREGITALRGELSVDVGDRLELRLGQDLRSMGPFEYQILVPGEYRRDDQGLPRPLAVDTTFTNLRASTWAEGAFQLRPRLRLTGGLRLDYYGDLRGEVRLSPRVLLAFAPSSETTVSLAAGRYTQSPSSIWLVGDRSNPATLSPFRADQLVAGIERLVRPDLRLQVQGYYKRYSGYPTRVYRPQAVLALSGFEDVQSDIPFGLEPLNSKGTGRAFGGEFLAQKRLSTIPLYGLASVSLNWADFTGLDGISRPGAFDTRLIGNLAAGYRPNSKWEFSGKFRIATGRPTTPFVTTGPDAGQLDFSQYNAGPRLPTFRALDLRVDRRWAFRGVQLDTYIDVQNVTGRKNVSQYNWDPRTGSVKPNDSLGVFPTIGITLEF